jgi:hypothetical protein
MGGLWSVVTGADTLNRPVSSEAPASCRPRTGRKPLADDPQESNGTMQAILDLTQPGGLNPVDHDLSDIKVGTCSKAIPASTSGASDGRQKREE